MSLASYTYILGFHIFFIIFYLNSCQVELRPESKYAKLKHGLLPRIHAFLLGLFEYLETAKPGRSKMWVLIVAYPLAKISKKSNC